MGDTGHPERDAEWNRSARHETETERLDRNWADLLQELRVVQTGGQLLTGFLLILPFQQRFTELPDFQRDVYLVTVGLAVAATALIIAPVSLHRVLFRQHARRSMVAAGHRFAVAGLSLLGLAVTGVILLIFDAVLGPPAGAVAAACAFVLFATLWGLVPWMQRRRAERSDPDVPAPRPAPARSGPGT
ncbi:DUF6328 family protein [Pseudonocardia bannensis]|uniref:Sodium:proton antiporter n=1 Tax=Pseudonocardia bannensis TaxID=630973 RepID=A0A848DCC4_9PSEU|nr:DUF6328 family protein [Pseudonocardia bannensis]NMH90009.1 sodium:proton antiporter [Pseudonocardia bannensis]